MAPWGLKVTAHHGTHIPPPMSYVPAGGEAEHTELLGWKRGHTAAGPQCVGCVSHTAQHTHSHQDGDSGVPIEGLNGPCSTPLPTPIVSAALSVSLQS